MHIRAPLIFILPLAFILVIALLFSIAINPQAAATNGKTKSLPVIGTVQIMVNDGTGAQQILPSITFEKGETVLAVSKRAFAAAGINWGSRDYGNGLVISEINGQQNGADDRYWQFNVNGTSHHFGANQYRLSPGDTLEWKFAVFGQK